MQVAPLRRIGIVVATKDGCRTTLVHCNLTGRLPAPTTVVIVLLIPSAEDANHGCGWLISTRIRRGQVTMLPAAVVEAGRVPHPVISTRIIALSPFQSVTRASHAVVVVTVETLALQDLRLLDGPSLTHGQAIPCSRTKPRCTTKHNRHHRPSLQIGHQRLVHPLRLDSREHQMRWPSSSDAKGPEAGPLLTALPTQIYRNRSAVATPFLLQIKTVRHTNKKPAAELEIAKARQFVVLYPLANANLECDFSYCVHRSVHSTSILPPSYDI